MERPRALVLRAAGTNCDSELCRAFSLAGAEVDLVHLDRLVAEPGMLDGYSLVGFPGGFSFGDDIASGRIFAMKVRESRGLLSRSLRGQARSHGPAPRRLGPNMTTEMTTEETS